MYALYITDPKMRIIGHGVKEEKGLMEFKMR